MKGLLGALRLLAFAVVGIVVASALFFVLNVLVSANYTAGTSYIEDWIVRASCEEYELSGSVRDTAGKPVVFAIVEVSYLGYQHTTRSTGDGTFVLRASEVVCDQRPPDRVNLLIMADNFRPKRQSLPFDQRTLNVLMDARDFRP